MMRYLTLIAGLAAVTITSGCAEFTSGLTVEGNQTTARERGAASDPFQQALASGYMAQGDEQYGEFHMAPANRSYRKSAAAAAGRIIPLEDPAYWSLHDKDRREVAAMRPVLAGWIDATKSRDPQAAAAQQLKYECWLEELSERDYTSAAACKPTVGPLAQAAPMPARVATACEQNPNGTDQFGKLCHEGVIYFGFDRYDLLNRGTSDIEKQTSAQQAAALDLIVRQAISADAARLDVYGRTDASGPENYNYGLSDCRARSVVDGLKAHGLPAGVDIRVIPLGKTNQIQQTASNARDATNRVVMVAYQTNPNAPLAIQPMPAPRVDAFGCGTVLHPYPLRALTTASTR